MMKIKLLIIPNEAKQVIFTPESDEEKDVLSLFNEPNLKIIKDVDFGIEECRGGYYRAYDANHKDVVLLLKKQVETK